MEVAVMTSATTQSIIEKLRQKRGYDKSVKDRSLNIGDRVLARDFSSHAKWFAGIIHRNCGLQSFKVRLEPGRWSGAT